jgi:murein DD-endopeptidase MepM/ murein hydrolase activator NlpD
MKPPFSVLVFHGDGARVLRFGLPRWIVYGALGVQTAMLAAVGGFSTDYALLRRQADALRERVDEQGARLDTFHARLPALRAEIAGWKALHAKMWKAFGPIAGVSDARSAGDAPPPSTELDTLVRGVAEEGPQLRELERVVDRTSKVVRALPLRWPIRGPVNSEYGPRRSPWTGTPEQHHGIDIGSPPGTPVASPAPGMVTTASVHGRLGKHVALDHGNGVTSLYGHLAAVDVKPGQRVAKGQVIGRVGSTGRSTGPHLHYELLVEGKAVDPRPFLPATPP